MFRRTRSLSLKNEHLLLLAGSLSPLLYRVGSFVTRATSLNTRAFGIKLMNKIGGRRKMFINKENAAS
jgi:hypothetical protein